MNNDCVCLVCTNKKVVAGYNDITTLHPNLLEEAYLIGNYMIGTDLSKCSEDSVKLAYWVCSECKNIYPMSIAVRVTKQERGHNPCPRCNYVSKKKVFVF